MYTHVSKCKNVKIKFKKKETNSKVDLIIHLLKICSLSWGEDYVLRLTHYLVKTQSFNYRGKNFLNFSIINQDIDTSKQSEERKKK
jgi:hypothetical protein